MTPCRQDLALSHLLLRQRPLLRALRAAIALRDKLGTRLREAGAVPNAISRGHADALLDQLEDIVDYRSISTGPALPSSEEREAEQQLRNRAATLGTCLPLDALVAELGLDEFECEVLVLCAGVELDSDFERLFGFIQDEVARRMVSVELACALTASSLLERVARRKALGAFGTLRRLGLVTVTSRESGLRDELRLSPNCVEVLLGTPLDVPIAFQDHAERRLVAPVALPADVELVARAADGLATGDIEVVAIWGVPGMVRDIVAGIATRISREVRCHLPGTSAVTSVTTAAALAAVLWIELDALGETPPEDLIETAKRARIPLVISGKQPWRPTDLLVARNVVEIPVRPPDHAARALLWQTALGEVEPAMAARLATSFHFDAAEVHAAARVARSSAALLTNGHPVTATERLAPACLTVARKHGERHTTLVVPRRGAADLVLPPDLHARVLDLVTYFLAMPRVMDDWGFGRRVSGAGVKALFTGEPGTGKTLAAEVVAKELGLPMLKVDLARVVSKWVGETEKNLDLVFSEAHDSHSVLFFDEAEALFGSRGDVRHGTDRYANLEVSYLLQRLEDHTGVVILATNLRDKIDQAFMRRFHAVVGFPRPGEKERKRIWQRVFGIETPMAGDLDLNMLARLDLTGAGIVGAAQIAALLAAHAGVPLSMQHVVRGLVRQFQREARVLTPHELGAHAVHIGAS